MPRTRIDTRLDTRAGPRAAEPPLRRRRPWARIAATLEAFGAGFPRQDRLRADPVHLAHAYGAPIDQEVAALVASALALGRAASLVAKARAALEPLGAHPADAVSRLRTGEVPRHLERWVHRWFHGRELAWFLACVGAALREHGSLGGAFRAGMTGSPASPHLLVEMQRFARLLRGIDPAPWLGRGGLTRGAAGLLPIPDGHSAAKRLCLYLRWMVRPDDGVDLGLWPDVGAHRLTVPLDTHVARIGRYVGLTRRRTPGWAMAREITQNLARLDPGDPTRHDFALSHLGIMGGCPRRRDPRTCAACDLLPICGL
jgi:uncharacterized protein (TIGR02757 family)